MPAPFTQSDPLPDRLGTLIVGAGIPALKDDPAHADDVVCTDTWVPSSPTPPARSLGLWGIAAPPA